FYWLVKKNIPWFGFGRTDMGKIRSYAKLSGWFMATMIFSMILFNSEKIILGYLVGPEMVTIYVLTLFASSAMGGLINAVISGVVPGIGNFFGKGEFEKILISKNLIQSIIWWFTFSIGTGILLFNQSFLNLWVGEGNYAGYLENLFILLIALQYIFFGAAGSFINVTLDLKTKVLLTGFSALISIGLAFLLVQDFEILGLCVSVLAGRMVLTFGFPLILKKKINDQSSFFTMENIRPLLITSIALIAASYLQELVMVNSWLGLISWGALTVAVLMPLFWVLGFTHNQRRILLTNLSKIKIFKINDR
ncbi:lipopolysaccharide biosynthesis protein, partial [Rhodonellum sp.]|nr:polysaccharide biosynthesis protein [Rhodonellum sp.]